jgi:hypothetical protein
MAGGNKIGDVRLENIRILILVHQDMKEFFRIRALHFRMLAQEPPPVYQEIIKIHYIETLFLPAVMLRHRHDLTKVRIKIGISPLYNLAQGFVGVAGKADHIPEDVTPWKLGNIVFYRFGDTAVYQLLAVVSVDNDEIILITKALPMDAQDAEPQMVKGAAP